MNKRLRDIRHVALDMDGTIYSGGTLFESTLPFLALMGELGIGHTFLTNNSSKSSKDYLARLRKIGITATPDQLYTSTQATIEYLREQMPAVRRLFVLGTASMRREMERRGFVLTADSATDEPDGVVVGFDTELTYPRLCRAAYWISQGKAFRRHAPGSDLPDRPADGAGGLRGDLRRVGAGGRARSGCGVGQARSVHVAGHSEPARAGAPAARDGGRPAYTRTWRWRIGPGPWGCWC